MKEEKLVCPICGEPTFIYFGNPRKDRLCAKHGQMAKNGEIEQCPDCGKWHNANEECECHDHKANKSDFEKINSGHEFCIVCHDKTPQGKLQCKNCYYETVDYMNGLNKNSSMSEFRDYYYNLKDVIYRMKDFEKVKSNCNKLIAIAYQNANSNDDNMLLSILEKDITKIIETKKPKEAKENNIDLTATEKDEQRESIYPTIDGHRVKSQMEVDIDNALWNATIMHAYEQPIKEFIYERKKCDWFIPITGPKKGIYIEYWGMKSEKYLKDRKEKEELYKKYNVPYVGIEKDAPKDSNFINIIIQELQRKAYEYFGFMPEWKK